MGSKKKTTQVSNQTQTVAPPTWTMPGIQDASNRVNAAIRQIPQDRYQGDFIAGVDQNALNDILAAYRNTAAKAGEMGSFVEGQLGQHMADPVFNTQLPTARFTNSDPQNLDGVINAAINPVFRQLTEQILPSIRSSALESGAYSGDRAMGVVPTQAIQQSNEAAQRLAAEIGYEDYNNRENRRLQAHMSDEDRALAGFNADTQRVLGTGDLMTARMGQLPDLVDTIMRMSSSQGDLLSIAADREQAARQNEINNALAKEDYAVRAPFLGLDIASDLLARLSGNYGTTTQNGKTTTTEKTGGLGEVVKGAMGLASMAASFAAPGAGGLGSLLGRGAASAAPIATTMFSPFRDAAMAKAFPGLGG